MRTCVVLLLVIASFLAAFSVPDVAKAQELEMCLVDSLNGKERKQLVKWIFFSIAIHPEMKQYADITDKDRMEAESYVAGLLMRLLTEDCTAQVKSSFKQDPQSIERAFGVVGQVAMQELMMDRDVNKALMGYLKYMDMEKLGAALEE